MKRIVVCFLVVFVAAPTLALAGSRTVQDVEPVYQTDYDEVLFTYRGQNRSVSSSGCGATCASMVLNYYLPEVEQTPETLLMWVYENDLYKGNGLSSQAVQAVLKEYGIEGKWIGGYPNQIRRALLDGKLVIALMGKGTFSNGAHYILLCGVDYRKQIYVMDPASEGRSKRWYPLEGLIDQAANNHAFFICEPPTQEE